jgi:catechol 2,3-dioxygenase-like lactoylglutathione lyase family enzyme
VRIHLASVFFDDQEKALRFYADVLGFVKKDDVHAEVDRLRQLGVRFPQEPLAMGPVTIAVLDDTCGNLIQIVQRARAGPPARRRVPRLRPYRPDRLKCW